MSLNIRRQRAQISNQQQIINSDCCASFARSSSETFIYPTAKSQNSLRSTRERGIKLSKNTPHSKSASQTKIPLASPFELMDSKRFPSNRLSSESYHTTSLINGQGVKRSKLVPKCLQYKNKRIEEHKQQLNFMPLELSTKDEVCSTMRATLKTLNSFEGALLIQKPIIYSNSVSFQQPFLKRNSQQRSNIYSQRTLLINKKSNAKTLQKIFEQAQGKKIMTLESQFADEDGSNQYSIAQSYEFPQTHI